MEACSIFKRSWKTTFAPGWRAEEHQHPSVWEIILVSQGSVEINYPTRRLGGTPGSVIVHPPRTPHWEATTSQEPLKMTGVYLAQPSRFPLPGYLQDRHGRIGHILDWINDLQLAHGDRLPVFDDLSRAILFECQQKDDGAADPRLLRVRSFVDQAQQEELSVEKLAEVAGMSRRHFTRRFTEAVQMSPMAYVRKVRLEKARSALTLTTQSIREIAFQTGFRDEYEFSRVFRRALGIAPSALRVSQKAAASDSAGD